MTTYFHEISHGLSAIITGGSVNNIVLHLQGSGLCYTQGGIHFIVAFSGYFGAALWGSLIYLTARHLDQKHTRIIAYGICFLIALTTLLWGRDLITFVILIVLGAVFWLIGMLKHNGVMALFIQFIGLYIIRDAVTVPLYLIDGRHYGDGARLADMTYIPEIIWVVLWTLCGILALIMLWKSEKGTFTH